MNFFQHQDQARNKTRLLVVLFLIAVVVILVATNLAVVIAATLLHKPNPDLLQAPSFNLIVFSWKTLLITSTLMISVITVAVLHKTLTLRRGGQALAYALGGRPISPSTTDSAERRLLNVVAEMAIASGMPVPEVYVLRWERGINAFSAGHCASDAVIGITQGCLTHLNRAQLQGIIAHEFSHILNGDMHLNLRLIAILHGITCIGQMGRYLLGTTTVGTSSRIGKGSGYGAVLLTALGIVLIIIGWLGNFLGSLIRSAIVNQREYLADAAAVQFTRNPEGISDVLRMIGGMAEGSEIYNIHAIETSHLFFANALLRPTIFTQTHPCINARIHRILPTWNGRYIYRGASCDPTDQNLKPVSTRTQEDYERPRRSTSNDMPDAIDVIAGAVSTVGTAKALNAEHRQFMKKVSAYSQNPLMASALCYAVVLNPCSDIQAKQKDYISKATASGTLNALETITPFITQLPQDSKLALLELSFPCLRRLSESQYLDLKQNLIFLIKADQRISIFEWCVFQLIRTYLDKHFGLRKPVTTKYRKANSIAGAFQTVLSMLVHEGSHSPAEIKRAFGSGANQMGLYTLSPLSRAEITIDSFTHAITKLGNCSPSLKEKLINAMITSAQFDKQLSALERSIITSVSAAMDAPLGSELLRTI